MDIQKNCNDPACFPYCLGCNPGPDREWFVVLSLVIIFSVFLGIGTLLIALYVHERLTSKSATSVYSEDIYQNTAKKYTSSDPRSYTKKIKSGNIEVI